jgi:mono/diheme cytochrome c family protein
MREITVRFAFAFIVAMALVSCESSEKSQRGIELMPDMYHTPAYKSQQAMVTEPADAPDKKQHQQTSLLVPVPGTVPRDFVPYQIGADDWATARKQVNPLSPTEAVLKEGQHAFNIYCAVCHGRDGNAANKYIPDKNFPGIPSVNGVNVAAYADGEIYHIMTVGKARMPNYRAQLMPQTRWAVVHYLRALTRATLALQDVEKMVQDAELALRQNPGDANKRTQLETDRSLLEQRKHDLELIQRVGEGAGEEFKPLSDPVPEYVVPTWPEADSAKPQEHP